ncbi:hypothetical protein SAMN05421736_11962 [Evansella caseinilytica]|uniref:Uncharacterized protein n=1 Tax=Evansella caseinilytica TaxID=1503961 RepID=A0A1H3U8K9_9BACI|nr:hypothetical protein [Evansella caseinilytica]SDZ58766.1 hypothetical protein SAMN05421736_11962 [Evansella caseinilytica]
MGKWNEEGTPNLNLSSADLKASKLVSKKSKKEHAFSEELADGGERNEIIRGQQTNEVNR